jgi:hypothetical protein
MGGILTGWHSTSVAFDGADALWEARDTNADASIVAFPRIVDGSAYVSSGDEPEISLKQLGQARSMTLLVGGGAGGGYRFCGALDVWEHAYY